MPVVCFKHDDLSSGEGIAGAAGPLLIQNGIAIAQGWVTVTRGVTDVVLTNFWNQLQEIADGTPVVVFEDVLNTADCFVL